MSSVDWLANKAFHAAAPHDPGLLRLVLGNATLLAGGSEAAPPPAAPA